MGTDSKDTGLPLLWNRRLVPNGWTGGQYSLYRVVLAAAFVLAVWLVEPTWFRVGTERAGAWTDAARNAGWGDVPLAWVGPLELTDRIRWPLSLAAVLIAVGWYDRWAALAAFAGAVLVGAGEAWWILQVLLFAHVTSRAAPYGSVAAAGRPDPGGGWRRAEWNFALAGAPMLYAAWFAALVLSGLLLTAARLALGLESIASPPGWLDEAWTLLVLALASVPVLARSASLQRALWIGWLLLVALAVHRAVLEGWIDRPLGPSVATLAALTLVAFAAFDPALVPPRRAREPEVVYYDGDCGLCHRTVRFLLAEDRGGAAFRYAALQGTHFAEHVGAAERAELGDSVIVRAADGRLLQRSSAAVHLLLALGGLWRLLGALLWCVPRPLRDLGYDGVARVRKRVFPAPEGLCPLIPPELGRRFLP